MKIEINTPICALFKLVVRKKDGTITRESGWFKNRVLSSGLARMGVGTWINRCCVGSGNSTPASTQVALDNFIASTTTQQQTTTAIQTTNLPYYTSVFRTWRFAEGVATGNISEVGMGWGDSDLWNRALIRDANGSPTTITILSDEVLDVVAEIRTYPTLDFSGSFERKDKLGNVEQVHTYAGKARISTAQWSASKVDCVGVTVFNGSLVDDYTSRPNGAEFQLKSTTTTSYPTATSALFTVSIGLNSANTTHNCFFISHNIMTYNGSETGGSGYKIQITPPYVKPATKKVVYKFVLTWGEYEDDA